MERRMAQQSVLAEELVRKASTIRILSLASLTAAGIGQVITIVIWLFNPLYAIIPISSIIIVAMVICSVTYWLVTAGKVQVAGYFFVIGVTLLAAIITTLFGGFTGPMAIIYLFPILIAGMVISINASFLIATLAAVLYLAMIGVEQAGLLPQLIVEEEKGAVIPYLTVGTRVVFFYLIAFLSWFAASRLSQSLRLRAAELNRANEELSEAEELYRTLATSSPVGVYLVQDGKFQFVNPQFQKYMGFTEDELLGTEPLRLVHPEDRETVRENAVQMLKGNRFPPYEFRAIGKGEETIWAMETVASVHYKGKRATLGNFMDITERKQAEEALRESEARLQSYLENAPDGVYLSDLEGTFLYGNKKAEEMVGYKREELIGKSWLRLQLLSAEDLAKAAKILAALEVGRHTGPNEYQLIRKDGSRLWIEITNTLIKRKGKIEIIGFVRDITEHKQMEGELRETHEQLIRSERLAAIGQLAGGVGHELRNPLGAIKNAVYYVKRKLAESELAQKEPRVMEFLNIMDDEINASNKIISDLLGFSRVGKPSVSPTRIEKVIEDALSRTAIPENIELTKKLDADLPEVEIDADQVHQVLLNMITNAVEAMPQGGKLTIAAREKEKFLEVKIADTGCGIPREAVDKIFDPLFTTKAKGIGLGLAVCKAIIDRHQGNIEVESRVGKGTTLIIKLPLKAE